MQELASLFLCVYGGAGFYRRVVLSGICGMQTHCGNLEDSPSSFFLPFREAFSDVSSLVPKPMNGFDGLLLVLL